LQLSFALDDNRLNSPSKLTHSHRIPTSHNPISFVQVAITKLKLTKDRKNILARSSKSAEKNKGKHTDASVAESK
jgi:hypothetical protein